MLKNNFGTKFCLMCCAIVFFCACFVFYVLPLNKNDPSEESSIFVKTAPDETVYGAADEKLFVTFFNVGMGDCTFIRYKDIQILIDSGEYEGASEQGLMNADKIVSHIKNSFVGDDKTLDYVIVTHGDSDHLGNMSKILEQFDNKNYFVGNIIDFDSLYYEAFYQAKWLPEQYEKNKALFDSKCSGVSYKTTDGSQTIEEEYHDNLVGNYQRSRDKLVKKSTKYYCVAERLTNSIDYTCIFDNGNSPENVNSAESVFNLGGKNDPVLRILYNKNYFDLLDSESMQSRVVGGRDYAYYVNSKSVLTMITFGKTKVLLTGDLEETHDMNGETNLIETYKNDKILDNVTLYKAAHHGSETSNSLGLLKVIKPKNIAISAIANSKGSSTGGYWNFPRQKILENFLSVTNNVYITSFFNESISIADSYYGNITFELDENENVRTFSDSNADKRYNNIYGGDGLKKLIDTDWFNDNRYLPLKVHVFSGYQSVYSAYFGNCVLIKYGVIEVLIDCGIYCGAQPRNVLEDCYIKKLEDYCLDEKLEYVIVTSPYTYSVQQLVDTSYGNTRRKGVLNLYNVENLIDGISEMTKDPSNGYVYSLFNTYESQKKNLKRNGTNVCYAWDMENKPIVLAENLSLNILKNPNGDSAGEKQAEAAVCCYIEFCDKKLLFMGNISEETEKEMLEQHTNDFSDVIFFNAIDYGHSGSNSERFLNKIHGNDRLYIAVNSIAGDNLCGEKNLTKALCDRLLNCSKFCYLTVERDVKGEYKEICGDIIFSVKSSHGMIDGNPSLVGSKSTVLLQDTAYYRNLN